jgi:hypothetical protein
MVLVTTTFGFLMGDEGHASWALLLLTLLSVGGATGGVAVLNNYLERDFDAKWFGHNDGLCRRGCLSQPGRWLKHESMRPEMAEIT